MTDFDVTKIFSDGRPVQQLSVFEMAKWFRYSGPGKLRLPPIQRSFVWRNEQIVNYWDSLMRGYPAGMMLVTKVDDPSKGRDEYNSTGSLAAGDFELFDGQQRLAAILLGLGVGSLAGDRSLWIEFGTPPEPNGERLCEIRVNSSGQPFGYRRDTPNEKFPLIERREAYRQWKERVGTDKPDEIYENIKNREVAPLIGATQAVSFKWITNNIFQEKNKSAIAYLYSIVGVSSKENINIVLQHIDNALRSQIVAFRVVSEVIDGHNYQRLFARIGQGGTRLSDDELTYSLIKKEFPEIHDTINSITRETGRFVSETDLALGALRVAKTIKPWPNAKEWERRRRPSPIDFETLKSRGKAAIEYFREITGITGNGSESEKTLAIALKALRSALEYSTENYSGLPNLLLARLPKDLLDVLLLFEFKRTQQRDSTCQDHNGWGREQRRSLIAFVIHWLLYVFRDDKASYHVFEATEGSDWTVEKNCLAQLIRDFEAKGYARHSTLTSRDWEKLCEQVKKRGPRLATWSGRFTAADTDDIKVLGDTLRVLSTHDELKKRVLMWLQRKYITRKHANYDPTSTRDEDLPLDLDHAIPRSFFDGDARTREHDIGQHVSDEVKKAFKEDRYTVGDSLGNLRWFSASDNRARQANEIEPEGQENDPDKIPVQDAIDRKNWNDLISKLNTATERWTIESIVNFQRLIDLRTLAIVKKINSESGIDDLLGIATASDK